jgi:hypothetical protein
MGQVLQFRLPLVAAPKPEADALDLASAVDFATRDLAEIARHITVDAAREQALACLQMLQDALAAELARD